MNVFIDLIHDSITITKTFSKKMVPFKVEKSFEYPLIVSNNAEKALTDILDNEVISALKSEKSNSLILGDDLVSFNIEELPIVSKGKLNDIFETRFKMYFPNFKSYFLKYSELERNSDRSYYFYEISKREKLNNILNLLKAKDIQIGAINHFSNVYANTFLSQTSFPTATLIIGENRSEIFITKGNKTFAVDIINIGSKQLLEKEKYMASSYNLGNDESKKFAACVKANFAANLTLTDEMILSYEKEDGLDFAVPREVRAIKGASLETYNLKNNFRKFTSMMADFVDAYSQAPWFMPVPEINVYANSEVFELLEASAVDTSFKYVKASKDIETMIISDVVNNDLFSQEYKEKRRKIDWAKFFSMEIGGKKKKA